MSYISYLYLSQLSPQSVQSHLSALNFIHQAKGGTDIFTDFWITRIMTGFRKINPTMADTRLPITKDILYKLCSASSQVASDSYTQLLYQSMFLLSFHGFLRIGEITTSSMDHHNPNLLQLSNISIQPQSRIISIKFINYKHSTVPFVLDIPNHSGPYTLFTSLVTYLALRGTTPGPLFIKLGRPITRNMFAAHLSQCLQRSGLGNQRYTSHSFRIGAATTAITKGHTPSQVQAMGRWRSSAFKKYIRIQSMST